MGLRVLSKAHATAFRVQITGEGTPRRATRPPNPDVDRATVNPDVSDTPRPLRSGFAPTHTGNRTGAFTTQADRRTTHPALASRSPCDPAGFAARRPPESIGQAFPVCWQTSCRPVDVFCPPLQPERGIGPCHLSPDGPQDRVVAGEHNGPQASAGAARTRGAGPPESIRLPGVCGPRGVTPDPAGDGASAFHRARQRRSPRFSGCAAEAPPQERRHRATVPAGVARVQAKRSNGGDSAPRTSASGPGAALRRRERCGAGALSSPGRRWVRRRPLVERRRRASVSRRAGRVVTLQPVGRAERRKGAGGHDA